MFEKLALGFTAGTACIVGFLVVLGLLIALPIMWLWNWLCPVLFGLPVVTFWQAWACSLCFAACFPNQSRGESWSQISNGFKSRVRLTLRSMA